MDPYNLFGETNTPMAKDQGDGPAIAQMTGRAKALADMSAIGSIPVFAVALVVTLIVLSKYE